MIAEKIHINLDIDLLRDELMQKISEFQITSRSAAIGGWALQSTNGQFYDGWENEFFPYNGPHNYAPKFVPTNEKQQKLNPIQNYIRPTQVSTPYLESVLNTLESLDLNPRKARVIRLTEKSNSVWHQDGVKEFYQARLHIPLMTNPNCFFETEEGKIHMEYGSIYLVHINQRHRITNDGPTARFHFVCHVWDQKGISEFHKYDPNKNLGNSYLPPFFYD